MNQRGPKRKKPLDTTKMSVITARLPTWLILRIEAEAQRLARVSGVSSINKSDAVRALLERALSAAPQQQ